MLPVTVLRPFTGLPLPTDKVAWFKVTGLRLTWGAGAGRRTEGLILRLGFCLVFVLILIEGFGAGLGLGLGVGAGLGAILGSGSG